MEEVKAAGNRIDILPLEIKKEVATLKGSEKRFSELLKSQLEPVPSAPLEEGMDGMEYTVKPGDSLWKICKKMNLPDPFQIAKDNGIANPHLLRPGQKLILRPSTSPSPENRPSEKVEMVASWYGAEYHNKITASGQRFNMYQNTLAHNTLPFGTKVRLTNPENGRVAEGVVNDRGPSLKGRDLDVSYALAKKLGFLRKGVTKLQVEIL